MFRPKPPDRRTQAKRCTRPLRRAVRYLSLVQQPCAEGCRPICLRQPSPLKALAIRWTDLSSAPPVEVFSRLLPLELARSSRRGQHTAPYNPIDAGWSSESSSCLTTSCVDFQGTIAVTGPNPSVPIDLDLSLACDPGGSRCNEDYSDTGVLSLALPSGVTYTSASGVFLTATPEPATFLLIVIGLASLAVMQRSVRTQTAKREA